MSAHAFRFRIELRDIEPSIWRLIQVPSEYSFWDLHVAIQDAMGWLDYHLHSFKLRNPATGQTEEIGIPSDDLDFGQKRCLPGWETQIAEYFLAPGDSSEYWYDFGDDWNHTINLEEIVEIPDGHRTLRCLDGARACPPEDCGGPPGYKHLLSVLRDPKHSEYRDLVQWVGGSFESEAFEPSKVNFDDPRERWKIAFEEG